MTESLYPWIPLIIVLVLLAGGFIIAMVCAKRDRRKLEKLAQDRNILLQRIDQ